MYYNYWSSKCICKYLKKWINVDDLFLYYIFVEYIFIEWEQFYLITDFLNSSHSIKMQSTEMYHKNRASTWIEFFRYESKDS